MSYEDNIAVNLCKLNMLKDFISCMIDFKMASGTVLMQGRLPNEFFNPLCPTHCFLQF